ncbi:hypothetical protein [Goodfellowiella coeruleoviolacea]|uniref:hypothetical protein n=1 Tax=Goodfellowiella coeruleoviolacea TaxID=334858 RepID=UPI0020A5D21F|nr:hypothetical protein [Goodfellowiella coeruleoviolacea]
MSLASTDTLVVEQPWSFGSLLWRTRYRATAYDGQDRPVAVVAERRGPGLLAPVRLTGLSGRTPFDLRVCTPDSREVLGIRKGFALRRPRTHVLGPRGEPLGSIQAEPGHRFALLDAHGQRICLLADVAALDIRALARRDGRRVRRDVLRVRPGTPEPLRSLVLATGLAFDVVRNVGTWHYASGAASSLPAG